MKGRLTLAKDYLKHYFRRIDKVRFFVESIKKLLDDYAVVVAVGVVVAIDVVVVVVAVVFVQQMTFSVLFSIKFFEALVKFNLCSSINDVTKSLLNKIKLFT